MIGHGRFHLIDVFTTLQDVVIPIWLSISTIFSTLFGSMSGEVIRFSTARTTPSDVCIPMAVDPSWNTKSDYQQEIVHFVATETLPKEVLCLCLLYLNSNFALPLGYLNPALKKPARWVRSDKVEQSFLAEKRDLVELGPRNRATTRPILLWYFMAPLNKLLNHDLPFSL